MAQMKKNIDVQLKHLYNLAVRTINLPEIHKNKIRRMITLANKYQIRLSKNIKRNLCLNCFSVLIPSINCNTRILRLECGFSLITKCNCGNTKTFVIQGK